MGDGEGVWERRRIQKNKLKKWQSKRESEREGEYKNKKKLGEEEGDGLRGGIK
jgi:hypothetical protein